MDWASGHWPGIVHMCVWMRASCLGWGVVLWVRGTGIIVTGYKAHQDPFAPLRGDTWPDTPRQTPTPQADSSPTSQAAWHPDGGSSLAVRLLTWGRRDEINSSVISVWWLRDPLILGMINIWFILVYATLFYSILLFCTLPLLFCSVLNHSVLYSVVL